MGKDYWISWFGARSLEVLYCIKEHDYDTLTQEQRAALDYAIRTKEAK